jgi:hypothetical protein
MRRGVIGCDSSMSDVSNRPDSDCKIAQHKRAN